MKKISRPSMKK